MEFFQVQISLMRQNVSKETPQCTSQRLPMSTIGKLQRNALSFVDERGPFVFFRPNLSEGLAQPQTATESNARKRLGDHQGGPSEGREFCNFSGGTHLEQIVDLQYFSHIDRTLPLRLEYINVLI